MTIELTVEEVAKLRVCSSCVGEAFLSGEIRSRANETVCSYCRDEAPTYSIDEIADEIEAAFRDHYYLTDSDPDLFEYHAWMDDEIDYQWEREGDPVTGVNYHTECSSTRRKANARLVVGANFGIYSPCHGKRAITFKLVGR